MQCLRYVVVALVAFSVPLGAQQTAKQPAKPGLPIERTDSLGLKASPELQKSLEDLAAAIQALGVRIANDPQLRAAALQVATGVMVTAQQVVSENSTVIQEALKTAAERIATAETARKGQQTKRP